MTVLELKTVIDEYVEGGLGDSLVFILDSAYCRRLKDISLGEFSNNIILATDVGLNVREDY